MEIINTIWNALNTENETVIRIISLPMLILELTISMLLFTTLLNITATKKQKFLYVILLSLIGLLNIWFIPTPYNTFLNIFACPMLVCLILKTNVLKSILSEIVTFIIFTILTLIVTNIYMIVLNLPNNIFINIPIHKLCCSLLMYLFAYLLYLFFKHSNISISVSNKISKRKRFVLILNLLAGIIAIAIQSYIATLYTNYIPFTMTLISIVILLIYFFINMYSLSRTSQLEVTAERLEEEQLYNKTITILYDNIRGFKHNFNNIVQALGGYISTNNMEGLQNYYKDLLNDSQKANSLAVLNPSLINNPAVYSILTSKYHEAEKLEIKMNLEIFLDMENLNIKTYDLTIILGILLDNAIEASNKSKEKEVNVIIRKDNKANRDLFVIENTYINKNVDVDRIFEKGYTSKNDKDTQSHGLGLWNVRKIIKKYGNINLFTNKDDKLFKQQLEIYY